MNGITKPFESDPFLSDGAREHADTLVAMAAHFGRSAATLKGTSGYAWSREPVGPARSPSNGPQGQPLSLVAVSLHNWRIQGFSFPRFTMRPIVCAPVAIGMYPSHTT